MSAIIWIASFPRSGNTWTRIFIHNLFNQIEGKQDDEHDINAMGKRTTWEMSGHWYEDHLEKPIDKCSREEIAQVRLKAQETMAAATEGLLFAKTHNALVMCRGAPAINTKVTAGAIYIIRNPLDVVISYAGHYGISIDRAIEHMNSVNLETPMTEHGVYEVYGSWSQNVATWTAKPHQALHIMRYEDMLENPGKIFKGLARHLLIEPTEEQLDRAVELSSFKKSQKQELEEGFRERPEQSKSFFRVGKAEQWRTELTEAQIRSIVDAHREQMARFDYVPEGY